MSSQATCCIFVPLYKLQWSPVEILSLKRCMALLSQYHFVFAYKASHDPRQVLLWWNDDLRFLKSWSLLPLDDIHLSSVSHYNLLMLSADFYKKISKWDYVLVFQLDAWILGGNLDAWLSLGYTYVGAPWCPRLGSDPDCFVEGVGNGGLSLRNIADMIKILGSPRYKLVPVLTVAELISSSRLFSSYNRHNPLFRPIVFLKRIIDLLLSVLSWPLACGNSLSHYTRQGVNEDFIIGIYCPRVFKWMRMPSLGKAAHFSLETNAKEVFAAFSVGIPFGCHAWERRDRDFFVGNFPSCFEAPILLRGSTSLNSFDITF